MKVLIEEGHVKRISKEIPLDEAQAESVGLVVVRGEKMRTQFRKKLLSMAQDMDNRNRFWLEIFNSMIAEGKDIDVCEISPDDWREIDFHPDVEAVKKAVFKKIF